MTPFREKTKEILENLAAQKISTDEAIILIADEGNKIREVSLP